MPDKAFAMTTELQMLLWCGLLSLGLALLTIAIHFRRFGGKSIRSNREVYPPLDGAAGRVVRAHANLNEALLPFAIVVLVAAEMHVGTVTTARAATAFLVARIAHAGLYVAGVPEIRSIAYYVGLAATLTMAAFLL